MSSEVVSTNGQGHGALVGFLVQHQVNVVLCGGIGAGAQAALV
ncbi:MAG: NifB/NifX family molybdenum-iron cluster-binding protein [Subdoligranulum sp.]